MDGFVAKGRAQEQFCKDVVRAFASSNIPLSKLAPGSPMRQLFEKYMKVDGESPSLALVDPNNLRKTWVSKVHEEGVSLRGFFFTFPCLFPEVKKLKRIIEDGSWFVCLSADETDDPRSCNEYIVTVDCTLIPRIASAEADTNVKPYHLEMKFPKAMNTETMSSTIDEVYGFFFAPSPFAEFQVLRSFNIQPGDVHYFVHDSAPYMGPAAERLRTVLGYKNLVHVPCWAHLLDKIGRVVFDGQHLPELVQYLTLTRKLFARSPFWRTKWVEHQKGAHQEQEKLAERKVWMASCIALSPSYFLLSRRRPHNSPHQGHATRK